jgi:hypothetical protein
MRQPTNVTSTSPDFLLGWKGGQDVLVPIGSPVLLSAGVVIGASDDGKVFNCTTALTITFPELLIPRPSIIVNAPPSGNVSIARSGGALLNGAGTTLTRSRATNPAGFAVVPYAESDGYGVSGS